MPHPRVGSTARRTALAALVAAGTTLAGVATAYATTTDPNPNSLEKADGVLSRTAATEGMVLLENQDNALPMPSSGNVAIFGVGAYKTVKGGTGSGAVNNRYTITVRQGLENAGYHVTTSDAYWSAMTSAYDTKYGSSGGSLFGPTIDYSSVEQPLTASSVAPSAPTDTALFVVSRNAGEGADRKSGAGDYLLTDTEKNDIALIGQTYRHVVVVLNVGGIVDTSFYKDINASETDPAGGTAVDSLLLMSQPGQEAGNALVDVLNGTVDPSGHLTDTWASKYSYYPASAGFGANDGNTATEQYSEGIYVGYRYFDSFYKTIDPADPASVVNYPFGYGLSYTTFKLNVQTVQADAQTVSVRVKVTNTGTRSGKEVVQVYFSAPQSGVDKPYQELAGYGKTDELQPGESQTLTLSYDTTQMASYDTATSAYVLDAGDYYVRVGDSSRSTHVAVEARAPQRRRHRTGQPRAGRPVADERAHQFGGELLHLRRRGQGAVDRAAAAARHPVVRHEGRPLGVRAERVRPARPRRTPRSTTARSRPPRPTSTPPTRTTGTVPERPTRRSPVSRSRPSPRPRVRRSTTSPRATSRCSSSSPG